MNRPRIIDLYCAAGGAGMGYYRAGFDVVGVDINPQPHYPFAFIQMDAQSIDQRFLRSFDAAHASPPCQRYSAAANLHGNSADHPDLIDPTRAMLVEAGVPFVIENVMTAPIRPSLVLCGTQFGLRIIKHRQFECSFPVSPPVADCDHSDVYDPWHGAGRSATEFREAQGTPWIPMAGGASRKQGVTGDLFNAIPPAFTTFIGEQLLAHIAASERLAA